MTSAYSTAKKNYKKKLEDEIYTSLDNITNWLKVNKLTIIVKNSNFLLLKVGNSQSAFKTTKIYIDFKVLDHKETAKYPGVYF